MRISVIDNCIQNLLRKAWGFILFKMEGKQYLTTLCITLHGKCYTWRLQKVFKGFMLLIILKSNIKISILGYRACGMCFPLGRRGMVAFVIWLVLGFFLPLCPICGGTFISNYMYLELRNLYITWHEHRNSYIHCALLLKAGYVLASVTTWSIFLHLL